jgi:thymidylate synthase (FAD)
VNYGKKDMEFIEPAGYEGWMTHHQQFFESACRNAESFYNGLLSAGFKPQQARAVLPNALKTEIVVTADAKEWMHIRKLRTHKSAHPDIVRVMNMVPWEDIG